RAQQAPAVLRRHETPHRLEPECTQSTKWTSSTEAYGPSEARERRRRSEVAERTEHPRRLGVGHFEVGEVALGLGELPLGCDESVGFDAQLGLDELTRAAIELAELVGELRRCSRRARYP